MSSVVVPNPDASLIYEGGSVSQIAADELRDNPVAIKQLINTHNLLAAENKKNINLISSLNSQLEYLKTSPFMSMITALLNVFGTILIAIGVNFVTSETSPSTKNITVLCCGLAIVVISSLANILYPFARGWFNKDSKVIP